MGGRSAASAGGFRGRKPNRRRNLAPSRNIDLRDHGAAWNALPGHDLAKVAFRDAKLRRKGALRDAKPVNVVMQVFHATVFAQSELSCNAKSSRSAIGAAAKILRTFAP